MTAATKTALGVAAGIAALLLYKRKPIGTVTTSEGFDFSPYGGLPTYPEPIKRTARAIASAEGFGKPGAIPTRAHNPGDLKLPGWTGPTLGEGICVFSDDATGWNALYKQLNLILTGRSANYDLDMTIAQVGGVWTATQQASWSQNVARALGVDVSTPLWAVLA